MYLERIFYKINKQYEYSKMYVYHDVYHCLVDYNNDDYNDIDGDDNNNDDDGDKNNTILIILIMVMITIMIMISAEYLFPLIIHNYAKKKCVHNPWDILCATYINHPGFSHI